MTRYFFSVNIRKSQEIAIREALPSGTDFKKAKPTDFQPVSSQPSLSQDTVELKEHESKG
ncbi:MAG: hypothetical protein EBY01_07585 [Actinobacteria bacterium]|nr:hypothetical protein [Actinomycetota bacterium]